MTRDNDPVWCANCDKQIVRTTTHGPLFDWVHRDTRKPSCEGIFARPRKKSVQVNISPPEPVTRIVPVPIEWPMRERPYR